MIDIYEAIKFALNAHENQYRKLDGDIYAAHPLEVAILLATETSDEEVIMAGVLHDTVEDTDADFEGIRMIFGERVANLVEGCTEYDKNLPWKTRKLDALEYLKSEATRDVRLIVLADKVSNIKSIWRYMDLQNKENIWDHFNAGYDEQKWYFQESLMALSDLHDTKLYIKFIHYIKRVFAE